MPTNQGYNLNFYSAGYGSLYFAPNLSTAYLIIHGYIILALFYLVLSLIKSRSQATHNFIEKIKGHLFWNGTLRFFIEIYLELSISATINIAKATDSLVNTSTYYCLISSILFGIFVIVFPIWIAFFYGWKKLNVLEHPKFRD